MRSLWAKLNEWFPRSPDGPTRLYASAVVELDLTVCSLSAWSPLKPQFTVACGICSTIVTTMKSVS
jgi:hypothetical protein